MMTKQQALNHHASLAANTFAAKLSLCVEKETRTQEEVDGYLKRLPRALEIVTLHPESITHLGGGVYEVTSTGKNKAKTYRVDSASGCSCPDATPDATKDGGFPKAHAPRGWCKHRLAVFLRSSAHTAVHGLMSRMHGLAIPHDHTFKCGHGPDTVQCWDETCVEHVVSVLCPACHPVVLDEIDKVTAAECAAIERNERKAMNDYHPEELDPREADIQAECEAELPYEQLVPEQYEVAPVVAPKPAPLPEAAASLNIKVKKGAYEFMYTMRGHDDHDILSRLPAALKGLEQALGVKFSTE